MKDEAFSYRDTNLGRLLIPGNSQTLLDLVLLHSPFKEHPYMCVCVYVCVCVCVCVFMSVCVCVCVVL